MPMKNLWKFCLVMITIMYGAINNPVSVSSQNHQTFEVVVIIDNSGSMMLTDPNRLAYEAAVLLADDLLLYSKTIEVPLEFRYGAVFYDTNVIESSTIPLMPIRDITDRNSIKSKLNSSYKRDGNYTDTPTGLRKAVELFEQSSAGLASDKKRFVVLLTDGTDTSPRFRGLEQGWEADPVRTNALERLAELGIPIYAVGFDFDPATQPVFDASLTEMAISTSGRYFPVSSAEEFNTIMTGIRGLIAGSIVMRDCICEDCINGICDKNCPANCHIRLSEPEQDLPIQIPDDYVTAATMHIFTMSDVLLEVFTPDGKSMPAGEYVDIFRDMNSYNIVQLRKPLKGEWKGEWTVHMSSEAGIPFSTQFLYDYRLSVDMRVVGADENTVLNSGEVSVEAWLSADGNPVTDTGLYAYVKEARFVISDINGNTISVLKPALDEHTYRNDLSHLDPGQYTISFYIEHKHFTRSSEIPIDFTVIPAPTPTPTPVEPTLSVSFTTTVAPGSTSSSTPTQTPIEGGSDIDGIDIRPFGIIAVIVAIAMAFNVKVNRQILINGNPFTLSYRNKISLTGVEGSDSVNSVQVTSEPAFDDMTLARVFASPKVMPPLYRLGLTLMSATKDCCVNNNANVPLQSGINQIKIHGKFSDAQVSVTIAVDKRLEENMDTGEFIEREVSAFGKKAVYMLVCPVLLVVGVIALIIGG